MATYVRVHGGAPGGWCCRRVARLLRAKGHDLMMTEPRTVAGALLEIAAT
jgi:hypothetical protein